MQLRERLRSLRLTPDRKYGFCPQTCTYMHTDVDVHICKQTSFQQASHLGNSYFRKEHSIGTNTACSSAYAPSASPAHPFPLAFLLTAPLLLSLPHLYISSSQTAFLANFLTFQPSFHPLFVSFHPCTCGHVTTEACSADKVTVS